MPTNVLMPQMGESITEGTLVRWTRKVGERIEKDEILFEMATDFLELGRHDKARQRLLRVMISPWKTCASIGSVSGQPSNSTACQPKPC